MDGTNGAHDGHNRQDRRDEQQNQTPETPVEPMNATIFAAMMVYFYAIASASADFAQEELGIGRMDSLPLQDRGPAVNPAALPRLPQNQTAISARWSSKFPYFAAP